MKQPASPFQAGSLGWIVRSITRVQFIEVRNIQWIFYYSTKNGHGHTVNCHCLRVTIRSPHSGLQNSILQQWYNAIELSLVTPVQMTMQSYPVKMRKINWREISENAHRTSSCRRSFLCQYLKRKETFIKNRQVDCGDEFTSYAKITFRHHVFGTFELRVLHSHAPKLLSVALDRAGRKCTAGGISETLISPPSLMLCQLYTVARTWTLNRDESWSLQNEESNVKTAYIASDIDAGCMHVQYTVLWFLAIVGINYINNEAR